MVCVLLVVQSSLKILNEAAIISFIGIDLELTILAWLQKNKGKDLAENVLSATEDEFDGRAAASKI